MAGRRHFVDRHRAALISRVSLVEPILDDLLSEDLLTDEQYDNVRGAATSQEKLRRLYGFVRGWGDDDKDKFYIILRRSDGPLIRNLEDSEHLPDPDGNGHFVDRHQAALTRQMTQVELILQDLQLEHLLTYEQCDTVRSQEDSEQKMAVLYLFASSWSHKQKDRLYFALRRHNDSLIQSLENPEEFSEGMEPDTAVMYSPRTQEGGAEKKRSPPPTYLTDALTCCICTDIYKDPITLPCGHSYCKGCINRTWEYEYSVEYQVACPECRVVHRKPPRVEKSWRLCELVEAHQLHMEDASKQE
ncbi:uncharacterized protein [Hyperolius riggenbachi]|uniref:uncharacterized protein isoform X2 n=1 Tax=Hyperolius riggenbachi TaxID=752182 RepID=UPI0035A3C10B